MCRQGGPGQRLDMQWGKPTEIQPHSSHRNCEKAPHEAIHHGYEGRQATSQHIEGTSTRSVLPAHSHLQECQTSIVLLVMGDSTRAKLVHSIRYMLCTIDYVIHQQFRILYLCGGSGKKREANTFCTCIVHVVLKVDVVQENLNDIVRQI